MNRPSAHIIGATGLAFLVTLLIGWELASDPSPAPVAADERGREIRKMPRVRPSRSDTSVSRKMDRIRNGATQVERIRAAISLAMALPPSEFAAWMEGDRFSFRSGPELNIFRMIIFERWMSEDPDALITWSINNDDDQARQALNRIAKNDPECLIAHFREHPNEELEFNQLSEIAKNHPSLVLARLKELHEAGGLKLRYRELLLAISENSTAELEAVLASLPDSLKKDAESVIFGRKLEKDFAGELGKLIEHPDGLRIFLENAELLKGKTPEIFAAVSDMPAAWRNDLAKSAFEFAPGKQWMQADLEAIGFSAEQAEDIRRRAFLYILQDDDGPVYVLNNLSVCTDDLHYTNYRQMAIAALISMPITEDGEIERILSGITSPEIREALRGPLEAARKLKDADGQAPSDWLRTLGELGPSSSLLDGVGSRLQNLNETQIAAYREGFRALSGDEQTNAALSIVKSGERYEDASVIRGDAILHLAQNPPAQDYSDGFNITAAASQYTFLLATNDPVAAARWVDSLPKGPARQYAAKNLANHWNQYDPEAAAAWIKTLPPSERDPVQNYLKSNR